MPSVFEATRGATEGQPGSWQPQPVSEGRVGTLAYLLNLDISFWIIWFLQPLWKQYCSVYSFVFIFQFWKETLNFCSRFLSPTRPKWPWRTLCLRWPVPTAARSLLMLPPSTQLLWPVTWMLSVSLSFASCFSLLKYSLLVISAGYNRSQRCRGDGEGDIKTTDHPGLGDWVSFS